jgi:hypothetical protein
LILVLASPVFLNKYGLTDQAKTFFQSERLRVLSKKIPIFALHSSVLPHLEIISGMRKISVVVDFQVLHGKKTRFGANFFKV